MLAINFQKVTFGGYHPLFFERDKNTKEFYNVVIDYLIFYQKLIYNLYDYS